MAGNVRVVLKSVWDDKALRQAQSDVSKMGRQLGAAAGIATAAFAAAGVALTRFALDAARGAEQAAVAQRRLDNIAKSMNIFGSAAERVSKRLGEFAEANELIVGVDADVIKATQAKLLTFKELAATADTVGGAMDRATMAALDLAAAGFGSAETNAIQLGKALNDPIKGITALRRAGVTFTKAEQDKIKALVEGNKLLEAQDLILTAIETQVGGTAQATASSFERITLAVNQVKDSIGEALLPVVEDFADELAILVPELQNALGPAAQEVATVVANSLLPAIRDLGEFLKTPEGIQAVKELSEEFVNAITAIAEFTGEAWKNRDAIVAVATTIGTVLIAYGSLRVALGLATAAQLIFNTAVKANPYVLAVTALLALVAAAAGFSATSKNVSFEARKQNEQIKILQGEIDGLNNLYNSGGIELQEYERQLAILKAKLAGVEGQFGATTGEAGRFNRIKMDNAIVELSRIERLVGRIKNQMSESAGEANRFRNMLAGVVTNRTNTPPPPGAPKADPKADARKRFLAIQEIIQDHQKKLLDAQKSYDAEVYKLTQDSIQTVKDLRKKEAEDLENIVKQSKKRLTDAFQGAAQVGLTSLFNRETVTQITENVRRLSASLTLTTKQETEKIVYGSVDDVIEGLRQKILGARNLINNASALAGLGFSQTFIEQIVEGGTETGNELAKAILEASPETQAEMKRLFLDLEDVSANGMKSVADRIYNEQKLATAELAQLYADTQELANANVKAEQQRLAEALIGAGLAFNLAVLDIKTNFEAALKGFDGAFGALGETIKAFLKKLDLTANSATADVRAALTGKGGALEGATTSEVKFETLAPIKEVSGLVIDSVNDVAGAMAYLQERIAAGNRYITNVGANSALGMDARGRVTGFEAELATLRSRAAAGQAAGTTININVKTDSTQSQAMVGKTIGSIVTKYVTTGGQVLVSGSN